MQEKMSILDIRKINFINAPNYNNYIMLTKKLDRHKEIFDNKFFAEATRSAVSDKNTKGLLFISQLYIELNRNVEAEYVLLLAYEMENNNIEILYYLIDILCRRKQLGVVNVFIDKIDKYKHELLFVKSMIKYLLLTNRKIDLDEHIELYFKKYLHDEEFVNLVFSAAIQNDRYYYSYLIAKTSYSKRLFTDLPGPVENRLRQHFETMIVNVLNKRVYESKNR